MNKSSLIQKIKTRDDGSHGKKAGLIKLLSQIKKYGLGVEK